MFADEIALRKKLYSSEPSITEKFIDQWLKVLPSLPESEIGKLFVVLVSASCELEVKFLEDVNG